MIQKILKILGFDETGDTEKYMEQLRQQSIAKGELIQRILSIRQRISSTYIDNRTHPKERVILELGLLVSEIVDLIKTDENESLNMAEKILTLIEQRIKKILSGQ